MLLLGPLGAVDKELDATVDEWTARLVAGPPLALSMTKCLLEDGTDVPMVQALHSEAWAQAVNFHGEDTAEAMGVFAERRPPTSYARSSGGEVVAGQSARVLSSSSA
ncbi:MAG: hypothetical protein M0Z82_01125 [Actinomycetota bacterium]|nr:hypothetical protein [Actinomycetota bacterium]